MGSFSGLGIGLSFVFGFILMGLVAELYYLLWWKKRKVLYSSNRKTENLEKPAFPWCWRKPNSRSGVSSRELTNSVRNEFEQEDVEMGATKLGYGEEGVESELMRLHNLCGPPRFLFTIKEESREDLESEDGKSRTSNCRSLNDHHVFGGVDGIDSPSPSPSFKASNLRSGEAMTEAELNRLRSSPPPTFKFLRDAEDKFLKQLQEAERKKRAFKNESLVQESAIVREGSDFVKLSKQAAQVMPLASSPNFQTKNP